MDGNQKGSEWDYKRATQGILGEALKLSVPLLQQWAHGPTQKTKLYRILQHTQFSTSKTRKA